MVRDLHFAYRRWHVRVRIKTVVLWHLSTYEKITTTTTNLKSVEPVEPVEHVEPVEPVVEFQSFI